MAVSLDRFAQGPPDPQDAPPVAVCAGCHLEIYAGEYVYLCDGEILHYSPGCLARYLDLPVVLVDDVLAPES